MQSAPITVQPGYYPPRQNPAGYPPVPQQGMYPPGYGAAYPGPPGLAYPGPPGPGVVPGAQPMAMMPLTPQAPPGCPPGLEYLTHIDQLLVHQQIEEVLTGWETENKYKVRNTLGQDVYFAAERSDLCARQNCVPLRPFEMTITDNAQREKIEVQSPPGTVIGYVQQDCSFVYPWFSVRNAEEETVLRIKGPCSTCKYCEFEFEVLSSDGTQSVGKISKQWSGLAKELFTDADNFGIQFPMDLDVKMKATMLAACFLIHAKHEDVKGGYKFNKDFLYFENYVNRDRHYDD